VTADPELVRVGPAASFPDGAGRVVVVGRHRVAVFRVGERFHAIQDACPHMGTSLATGRLDGETVVCAQHGWRFDLGTGRSDRRSGACVRVWEVRVEGGDVWVRPPADVDPDPDDDDGDWDRFRDPERYLR